MKKVFFSMVFFINFLMFTTVIAANQTNVTSGPDGWVPELMTGNTNFDESCEYRINSAGSGVLYATAVAGDMLTFKFSAGLKWLGAVFSDHKDQFVLIADGNTGERQNFRTISTIEKRCTINQVPSNMLAVFTTPQCPGGWSNVIPSSNQSDITVNAGWSICKKS